MVNEIPEHPRPKQAMLAKIKSSYLFWLTMILVVTFTALKLFSWHDTDWVVIEQPSSVQWLPEVVDIYPPKSQSCAEDQQLWGALSDQLSSIEKDQQAAFVQDWLFMLEESGCLPGGEFNKALYAFWIAESLPEEWFPRATVMNTEQDYEQNYREYHQRKAELIEQVESNLLPGESFDEAYARELNQLYQDIFSGRQDQADPAGDS